MLVPSGVQVKSREVLEADAMWASDVHPVADAVTLVGRLLPLIVNVELRPYEMFEVVTDVIAGAAVGADAGAVIVSLKGVGAP
jgi:hypothetical protein